MTLILLMGIQLLNLPLDRFNSVQRWYFTKDKGFVLTSDYILEFTFKDSAISVDTIIPYTGMKNIIFHLDTFNIYKKRDGIYLNSLKILSSVPVFDIFSTSDLVGILSDEKVYLLHLPDLVIDTIKLPMSFLSIILTDTSLFCTLPDSFLVYTYKFNTKTPQILRFHTVSKFFLEYGIKAKNKGLFLAGGITGVYPYSHDTLIIWGFYYDNLDSTSPDFLNTNPHSVLLLLRKDTHGKIDILKHFRFKYPVYPIMIKKGHVYMIRFNFNKQKKEIKLWKIRL